MTTQRVRICVGMLGGNKWAAIGWGNASDADMIAAVEDDAGKSPKAFHFIEADVPVPDDAAPIQGVVVSPKGV